ncbi:MAG: N-acetylneuraminate synthase family protein [Deltaproteobacteria bacterium]|nr:N-acetylneuraminate synthase family protein [Deltaproteobacteria bacterium]
MTDSALARRPTWLHDPAPGRACTIVGEVAQAHDGSLGMAHAFIDAIAKTGADAVKFQTHIAAAESTPSEPWRKRFSLQDDRRIDYWRRMEFTAEQWEGLRTHADDCGLFFLSSPFSLESIALLRRVGVAGWKIASGEVTHDELVDACAATGQPVILSSGMSTWDELDAAVARVQRAGAPLAVLQCSSRYPCPPEHVGLEVIDALRTRYATAVGLSDHSATIFPAIAAATYGVEMVEVHVTLSREMFGPDVIASVTTDELRELVRGVRFVETMRAHPVDKAAAAAEVAALRGIFQRSIVAARDLPAGTVLAREHVALKKPGTGIPPKDLPTILGRRLARALTRDQLLACEDLEGA